MRNQCSILDEHDLKEFARIAMNIKKFRKKIGIARNSKMFYTYSSRTQ